MENDEDAFSESQGSKMMRNEKERLTLAELCIISSSSICHYILSVHLDDVVA